MPSGPARSPTIWPRSPRASAAARRGTRSRWCGHACSPATACSTTLAGWCWTRWPAIPTSRRCTRPWGASTRRAASARWLPSPSTRRSSCFPAAESSRAAVGGLLDTAHVDQLTGVMLLVVTGVGFLIHLYSVGYMHGDPGYARFFAYLNLFVFSMTMLVLAGNFLLLYVFWEAVGLCSYLLIGFWYTR